MVRPQQLLGPPHDRLLLFLSYLQHRSTVVLFVLQRMVVARLSGRRLVLSLREPMVVVSVPASRLVSSLEQGQKKKPEQQQRLVTVPGSWRVEQRSGQLLKKMESRLAHPHQVVAPAPWV